MNPLDIQYELKKKGITQASIAKDLGVSEMMISNVITRKSVSDRIMQHIAEKLGRDHRAVFPDYYFAEKINETRRKRVAQVY